jgi:hypothetical protein
MKVNKKQGLGPFKPGQLVYFCGVATPWSWRSNAHLAGEVCQGESATIELWTGDRLDVEGLKQIAISDQRAYLLFPDHGRDFLTCRNFQFGAQMFGTERTTPRPIPSRSESASPK